MQKIRQDRQLGQNIRALRIASHMTQDQVIAKLQIAGCETTRSIYAQIECGDYNIRVSELVALKKIFGVDYNAFFTGMEDV